MPSSEDISNNSSPVPKENHGHYSVVSMPSNSMRCKSEDETVSLAKPQPEIAPSNPYVSLLSLEQMPKVISVIY